MKQYFNPYFLSGVRKYVERGDVFKVDDLEMFVLNSYPDHGFISADSHVLFKFGLNKEKCLEKINHADNEYAMSIINLEERQFNNPLVSGEVILRSNSESPRVHLEDLLSRLSICKIILKFCFWSNFIYFLLIKILILFNINLVDGNLSSIFSSSDHVDSHRVEMILTK